MAARTPPSSSQEGDGAPRLRAGLFERARAIPAAATTPLVSAATGLGRRAGGLAAAIRRTVRTTTSRAVEPEAAAEPVAEGAPSEAPSPDDAAPLPARRFPQPPPFAAALAIAALAVLFVAALTYYGAREFTSRAADTRAATEAQSLAAHSATIATGDAFNGYIQILRYADDPVVRSRTASEADRIAAMQQLLYLNNNKFASLAVADRAGLVLAATDPAISDVRKSEAFNASRADLGPANSDIVLPEAGKHGYVEFTAPLRDPGDGTIWAILYGRADPERLWSGTLNASVDGSRNVIVNNLGLFSTGVPDELLRQPWRGHPLDNGSVRADIAGVDSICGLGAIGRDTRIDHGWNVASCLPASLIQVEAGRAMGNQVLVTVAGAVLAVVLATGLLRFAGLGGTPAAAAAAAPRRAPEPAPVLASNPPPPPAAGEPEPASGPAPEPPPAPEPEPAHKPEPELPPAPVIIADVDALALIGAYERRSAALSERLRESVQARLMIAAAQAEEAYRLAATDAERAATLHAHAIEELEELRERELRALGQELHPSLVRLGLPGALRAMAKEFAESITIALDVDPASDAISGGAGRISVEPARRLAIYRIVRDAVSALAEAGATHCAVSVQRAGDMLILGVAGEAPQRLDDRLLEADRLAAEAYGGFLKVTGRASSISMAAELPAPHAEQEAPEDDLARLLGAEPPADGLDADLQPGETLATMLAALRDDLAPRPDLSLDIAGEPESIDRGVEPALRAAVRDVAEATVRALAADGAVSCELALRREGDELVLEISAETASGRFDASVLSEARDVIEDRDGFVAVSRRETTVTVTIEFTAAPAAAAATPPDDGVPDEQPEREPRLVLLLADEDDAGPPPLGQALQALADGLSGTLSVALDVDPAVDATDDDGLPAVDPALLDELRAIVAEALPALAQLGAQACSLSVQSAGGAVFLSIMAETAGGNFDEALLAAHASAIEARAGMLAVAQRDTAVSVTVDVSGDVPATPVLHNVRTVSLDDDESAVEEPRDGDADGDVTDEAPDLGEEADVA